MQAVAAWAGKAASLSAAPAALRARNQRKTLPLPLWNCPAALSNGTGVLPAPSSGTDLQQVSFVGPRRFRSTMREAAHGERLTYLDIDSAMRKAAAPEDGSQGAASARPGDRGSGNSNRRDPMDPAKASPQARRAAHNRSKPFCPLNLGFPPLPRGSARGGGPRRLPGPAAAAVLPVHKISITSSQING